MGSGRVAGSDGRKRREEEEEEGERIKPQSYHNCLVRCWYHVTFPLQQNRRTATILDYHIDGHNYIYFNGSSLGKLILYHVHNFPNSPFVILHTAYNNDTLTQHMHYITHPIAITSPFISLGLNSLNRHYIYQKKHGISQKWKKSGKKCVDPPSLENN